MDQTTKKESFKKHCRAFINFKHIIVTIIASIFIAGIMFLFTPQINSMNNSDSFLSNRECNYSIVIDKNLEIDTYALYNSEIIFSKSKDLDDYLSVTVLMETNNTHTNNDFFAGINISSLSKNEIALSSNVAKANKLSINDIVYSKNRVTNTINEYKVALIFPDTYGIAQEDVNTNHGVVIMGYDEMYLTNIVTNYIYYYNEDFSLINSSGASITGELCNLSLLRTNILKRHILYSSITIAGMILIIFGYFSLMFEYNKNILSLKYTLGVKSLFHNMKLLKIAYGLIVFFLSLVIYLIGTIWLSISFEHLVLLPLIIAVVSLISYMIEKNVIKWR